MSKIKAFLKRYRFFILMLSISFVILIISPETGGKVFQLTGNNLLEMASVLPPIFVLLGLLDVWVERETMVRYMGEGSGLKGALLGFLLGSAAAGPLYAAFPIAVVLLKKGAKRSNVFLFIGAWATTKLPLLLFEAANLGTSYMLIQFYRDGLRRPHRADHRRRIQCPAETLRLLKRVHRFLQPPCTSSPRPAAQAGHSLADTTPLSRGEQLQSSPVCHLRETAG